MSPHPAAQNTSPDLAINLEEWNLDALPSSADLPYDDGEPLESNRHRIAMNVLIRQVQQAFPNRTDFYPGGNMFIYYSPHYLRNQDFRGPDFFVVTNVDGSYGRKSWVMWEEGGRLPDVIVELLSDSTTKIDLGKKKDLYEQVFKTQDYYVFDPHDPTSLQGWHLNSQGQYEALKANQQGWLWCETLGLWLGTWLGTFEKNETCEWLRFYHRNGTLVPLPEEAALQQATQAQHQAEQAQHQVEQERLKAQQEQLRAEREQQKAEQAQHQADRQQQEIQRLRRLLEEKGIKPDPI